jgi:dGTPase
MMNWIKLLSYQRNGSSATIDGEQVRSAFEQDLDRIIFSHPFRRLQDKTQVFPLPEHDFVHTRLTHSLEVSSVGRSLGKKAGEVIVNRYQELQKKNFSQFDFGAIVAAASLTHDLGNPPFGHSGEDAISDFFKNNPKGQFFKPLVTEKEWADFTNFEGNAQGFRILNKKNYQGLKLTYATLAAFSKYPRESMIENPDKTRKSHKKYGFFQAEKESFKTVAEATGLLNLQPNENYLWCRHPLAFLVEAADDICYNIIDLEDGCRLGLVGFNETKDLLGAILGDLYKPEKLNKISSRNEKIGLLRAMAINILVEQSTKVFIDHEIEILEGRFDKALTDIIQVSPILHEIQKLSIKNIYRARAVMEREAAGFEVVGGLLEAFTTAAYAYFTQGKDCSKKYISLVRLLPEDIHALMENKETTTYEIILSIIDYISGMTDSFAISLYRKIKGISLPNF